MGSKDGVLDLFFHEVSVKVLKVASGYINGFPIYARRSRSAFVESGGEVILDDCLHLAVVGCPSIVNYALILVVNEILSAARVYANAEKLTFSRSIFGIALFQVGYL
jgi:hypothetical protein